MLDRWVDRIEDAARFLKARHVGEWLLFGISLLTLAVTIVYAIQSRHQINDLARLSETIQLFAVWTILLSLGALQLAITIPLVIKDWGMKRLLIVALGGQVISMVILLLSAPIK